MSSLGFSVTIRYNELSAMACGTNACCLGDIVLECQNKNRDWFKAVVHFLFGALLGTLLGMDCAGGSFWAILLSVLLPSLIVGTLSVVYLDRFWGWIQDHGLLGPRR